MQTHVLHRAAVCGKPIGHSLSPVIHNAGLAAAGLTKFTSSQSQFEQFRQELEHNLGH